MQDLTTTLREVTVFTNRARLTRRGEATLETGSQKIAIPNLPLNMDPASVRAKARGTVQAKLLGVDVRKVFFKETPPGRALELVEQIRKLEEDERRLLDQIETQDRLITHFDGLAENTETFAFGLSRGRTTIETHDALLQFVAEKRFAAQTQKREINTQHHELTQELEKLRKELQTIQSARPKERYSAIVELEINKPGKLEIELSYLQSGASWQPVYDIRLADNRLEISYLGQVTQSTGEDWNDITLTLSTASPALAGVIPELQPWYIAPMQPAVRTASAKSALAAPAPAPQAVRAPASVEFLAATPVEVDHILDAEITQAEVGENGASVTYKVGDGVNIPGDNSPRKTTIAIFDLPPQFDYVTSPRLVSAAYRRVKAANESPYMLLPGQAQLFEGDDYIGATRIARITSGQEIELYFGVDDRIFVERELVKRETDKKLLGDQRRIRFAYEINLENHTGETQSILVWDQIPVSRHENIKVKLESSEPKVSKLDDLNRLEWNLNLGKGEKQTIRYEFAVEAPRDMQIIGLQ